MSTLRFMIIGDLIGDPGIALFQKWAPVLKKKHGVHAIIVNGENSAKKGVGLSAKGLAALKESGADVVTTGNHAFDCKDIYTSLDERSDVLRPINYSSGCPGKGFSLFNIGQIQVAVVNISGRAFMSDGIDCPFKASDTVLSFLKHKTNIILFDFHGEATSEKQALGFHLDGKISAVVGTHTHIQTADERILPKGTGYITDLGCSGALNSVIGFEYKDVYKRMTTHYRFGKFIVETKGEMVLCGVLVDIDSTTGKTTHIERIRLIDSDLESMFT